MTYTKMLSIKAVTLVSISALLVVATSAGVAVASTGSGVPTGKAPELTSPDVYLGQHGVDLSAGGGQSAGDGRANVVETAEQLPSPDVYLGQRGVDLGEPTAAVGSRQAPADGFDWPSAGIGAVAGAGIAALLAGAFALISLRRRTELSASTS